MRRLCSTYVSTVLSLFFDCARPMFRQCSACFSTVLDLRFLFLDPSRVCFKCTRPMFYFSPPKSGMFRLCSTYVSTVLSLFFDCARPVFRLYSTYVLFFSTQIGYVSTVLDQCFIFLDPIRVCFNCTRPMFYFSRPKSGMFQL